MRIVLVCDMHGVQVSPSQSPANPHQIVRPLITEYLQPSEFYQAGKSAADKAAKLISKEVPAKEKIRCSDKIGMSSFVSVQTMSFLHLTRKATSEAFVCSC